MLALRVTQTDPPLFAGRVDTFRSFAFSNSRNWDAPASFSASALLASDDIFENHNLQPSTGIVGRRPSHLSLARFGGPQSKKLMTLSLDEFLRRFLLHLLPKGFVRIRHFGFLANRRRSTLLPLCFAALGTAPSQTEPETSTAHESDPL